MQANRTFEALAHVRRREVLRLLRDSDRLSAGQIAESLGIPKPTLSGHLNVLKSADLVVGERTGTTIWYRLNLTVMEEVLRGVLVLLSRDKDVLIEGPERSTGTPVRTSAVGTSTAGMSAAAGPVVMGRP